MAETTILILGLILFSAILSSSEIAILSLTRIQLKKIKDQSEVVYRRTRDLLSDSMGLLITILFLNEVVNITMGSLITSNVISPLGLSHQQSAFLSVMITGPIMLFFCELTPKVIAARFNTLVLSLFLPLIYFLVKLLKPLTWILKLALPKKAEKESKKLEEDDFILIAEEQAQKGTLKDSELELIRNVFELDDLKAGDLCTPLKKIPVMIESLTLGEAAKISARYPTIARFPVRAEDRDEIVGILHARDLVEVRVWPESDAEPIRSLVREPLFISKEMNLETLFRKMRSKRVQAAFVRGPMGRILGMITIQDILESLIEEAFEE